MTGAEPSSPRGRIHLMRAVAEERLAPDAAFAEEMDFCLLCRHCESVCPAGVLCGARMEHTRGRIADAVPRSFGARVARRVGFRWVLPRRVVLRLVGSLLRLAQVTGLIRVAARIAGARGRGMLDLPPIPPLSARRLLPARMRAEGAAQGTVWMLEGCVMPELYGRVNRATARVLSAIGFDVRTTRAMTCCGALHAHNAELDPARELGMQMIAAFERAAAAPDAAIVVNSAGCGAHVKELARFFADDPTWHARAAAFSERVVDFSEFVAPRLPAELAIRLADDNSVVRATYDEPCHLCHGQKIRSQPREILDRIAGLQRVEMPGSESCCGSAGIYSILRPADSQAVLAPKLEEFERSGAELLITANPGCQMQWQAGLARTQPVARVQHIAEVLDQALRASPQ
jgi:glycolate oxidase iron-sulfur subunit